MKLWLNRRNWQYAALLIALPIVSLVTGCNGGGATSNPAPNAPNNLSAKDKQWVESNERTKTEIQGLIHEVEEHLQLNSDGTLSLKSSAVLSTREGTQSQLRPLSPQARAFAEATLEHTNAMVKAGEVRVKTDFSLQPLGISTKANENGWRWMYWWGIRYAADTYRVNGWVAIAGTGGTIGGAVIGAWLGGPLGAGIGAALGAVPVGVLQWYNRYGTGIYFYYSWSPRRAWMEAQPR